jgi:putative transposase
MRDARSASQGFPPNFPNEFGASPSATRTVFSPRSKFEPKISLAQTFFAKRSGFWGRHFWSRGFFSATSGAITDEMVMDYIEHQDDDADKRGDDFTILDAT